MKAIRLSIDSTRVRQYGRKLAAALQRGLYVLVIVSLLAGYLPGGAAAASLEAGAAQDGSKAPVPSDEPLPLNPTVVTDELEITATLLPGPTQAMTETLAPTATPTGVLTDTQPTLSPTPTGVPTDTQPTISPTPTFTATLTVTPTVTPTVTLTPTIPVTVTPTITVTPVVTVTPPVIVQAASALTLTWEGQSSLALSVEPAVINPGDVFTLSWKLSAPGNKADPFTLNLAPSQGMYLLGTAPGVVSPTLGITLTEQGSQVLALAADAVAPFTLQVSVTRAQGREKSLAAGTLTIAQDGVAALETDGGDVTGLHGMVKVHFPKGAYAPAAKGTNKAAPQGMNVRVRPLGAAYAEAEKLGGYAEPLPPYTLGYEAFEISAWGQEDGAAVHQFTQPITIEIRYDESQLRGEESTLGVFYWEDSTQEWSLLLSWVDTENNILYALSDHLSNFTFNTQNWQTPRLPSLQGFQVSAFSGAAAYSYPIEVPPGPGGLQPALALSYSSQAVDGATGVTQAAWVGMGWSFETGYIERNLNGTMNYLGDDTFSLNLNGAGYQLYKDSNGAWHTAEKSFLRIIRHTGGDSDESNDTWEIWDKTGNKYEFGLNTTLQLPYTNRANYQRFACPTVAAVTWKWALSKTTNLYGVSLTYHNKREAKNAPSICGSTGGALDAELYPAEIVYPNERYRVLFVRDESRRKDYATYWANEANSGQYMFKRSLLTEIRIEHNPNGGSFNDATLVRKYVLDYTTGLANDTETIFPNYVWPAGGKTPTLKSIREYGLNGAALPPTTFSYSTDKMHLDTADNGYGGKVSFAYTAWIETTNLDVASLLMGGSGSDLCDTGNTNGWLGATCYQNEHLAVVGSVYKKMDPGLIHFGGRYRVIAFATGANGADTLQIGVADSQNSTPSYQPTTPATLPSDDFATVNVILTLAATAQQDSGLTLAPAFFLKCTNCRFDHIYIYPLMTRYRVSSKTVTDITTGQMATSNYRYDEAASNDAAHSAYITNHNSITPYYSYDQYFKAYSEFRGHAMVEESVPGITGLVNTTFFYQDDERKGNPSITMARTAENVDAFGSVNSSLWAWAGITPAVAYLRGDAALKLPGGASYGEFYRSASSITNGEMAMVQFYVSGSSASTVLALQNPNNANQRWAVYVDGSLLKAQYNNGVNGWQYPASMAFVRDQWYVLLMIADDNGFFTQVWKRDDPTAMMTYECSAAACGMPAGVTWRFHTWTANGTLYLDEYSEGKLHSMSQSQYDVTSTAMPNLYISENPLDGLYTGFKVVWTRLAQQVNKTFNGDAQWVGTQNTYTYDSYGNQSRVVEAEWRGSAWYNYRASETGYHTAAVNNIYLVGLPSYTNYFQCPSGVCSFTDADFSIGQTLYLYDGSNAHGTTPTAGKLTGQRTLLYFYNGDTTNGHRYSDVRYGYDAYGNQTTVTTYTGDGVLGGAPQGTAQTTTTCYGTFTWSSGACTSDGYNIYPQGVTNPLGHKIQVEYDKALGVPTRETDANGQVTEATYDPYGRILTIQRPGEESGYTTVQVSYPAASDTFGLNDPFYTEARQHIQDNIYFTIRKYYSGLGQLLQTQVVGAVVNGSSFDILADTYYNPNGSVSKQSLPYTVSTGSFYHVRDTSKPATAMTYDLFGRPSRTTSPDGSYTETIYGDGYASNIGYQLTTVRDPKGNYAATRTDLFGRTIFADAPTGPDVTYSYYPNDLLYQVTRGGATTTLSYDVGGRKTRMVDPDMGAWNYTYYATGNLKTQSDARGCVTTLSYDNLNRLTGKAYGASNCGSGNTNVTYGYDAYNASIEQYGRGYRTSMTDGSGSTAWTYNPRGLVSQEARTIGGTAYNTSWEYNSADLPKTMTYPDGEKLTYRYLPQMLLDDLMSNRDPGNAAANYYFVLDTKYDAAGRPELRWLGGAAQGANPTLVNDYTYNAWTTQGGRLARLNAGTFTSQASLFDQRYTYDNNGNISTILDVVNSSQKQCYGYDALNRLTSAAVGANDSTCSGAVGNGEYANEGYSYDSASGNLLTKTGMGTYSYPAATAARPHAVTSTTAGWAYSYDANGNMTRRDPPGTDYYDFVYDAENRIYQVKKNATVITTFTYDGDGNRVKSVEGSTTTAFVGNYYEISGSTVTKYYAAGGAKIAMRKGGTTFQWLLNDHLGSTSKVINANGTLHSQQLYKPWGESRYTSGTLPTKYTYTGQYSYATSAASDFGLMYYVARFYDPQLGRFTSPDSIVPVASQGVQAWDRYAGMNNNALRYTDPTGHDICDEEGNCFDQITHTYRMGVRTGQPPKVTDTNGLGLIVPPPDGSGSHPNVPDLDPELWYKGKGPKTPEGWRHPNDESDSVWKEDPGYDTGKEGEQPHWDRYFPDGKKEKYPRAPEWGRKNQPKQPGKYNEETGAYEAHLVLEYEPLNPHNALVTSAAATGLTLVFIVRLYGGGGGSWFNQPAFR